MKSIYCLGILLVATSLQAQTINPATTNTAALPTSTPYAVVSRDANSAVWQRQTYEIRPNGITVTNVDRYVELATGLNVEDPISGQFLPSKEEIDAYPGGAIAQYGQHKVIFANNLNTSGAIDLQTPDGKELRSDILGLSYYDTATEKSVLIAEVQDSQGQIVSSNQVVYPNAFQGVSANVRYCYTRAGLEQDVILLTQLPTPESFGLSSTSCVLQVLTEFTAAPAPVIQASPSVTNDVSADEMLDFGALKMVRGRAFMLGTNSPAVLISKQWLNVGGRTILVESLPLASITKSLSVLPAFSATSLKPASGSAKYLVSNQRLLPSPRTAAAMKTEMKLALSSAPMWGFDLDLIFVNSSSNAYTFTSDNTYWVTGPVNFGSDVTFEGGSVIKYSANASLNIYDPGQIICKGTAYRPTVFTSKDDNSVGTAIGSGTVNGFFANPAIAFNGSYSAGSSMTLHHFRISYALQAIYASGISVDAVIEDGQMVKCYTGFSSPGQTGASFENVLFANVSYAFELGIASVQAYNSTFSHLSSDLSPLAIGEAGVSGSAFLSLENCILANIYAYSTNMPNLVTGDHNGFYNSGVGSQSQYSGTNFGTSPILANGPPFRSVGGGNYYLTNGCNFFNAGTTNIDPALLAELRTKTIYPPILLTNTTISVNTNLSPQAARDTGTLALGYHYDPIDYAVGGVVVTNAALTVSPGTVIGTFNTGLGFGLNIGSGGRLVCEGLVSAMNRIVGFNTAQEGSGPWSVPPSSLSDYCCGPDGTFDFRFTDWSLISTYGAEHVNLQSPGCPEVNFRDCQFHGGGLLSYAPTFNLTNCLFDRVDVVLYPGDANVTVVRNNLFYGGTFDLWPIGSRSAVLQDNLFDRTTVVNESANYTYTGSNNAYVTNATNFSQLHLHPFGANDIILTNPPVYQTGPLGTFYQTTNSSLIHQGSMTADQVGLYHYTVTTNEVVEGTNIVSIGYHYVATDTDGIPLDSNGDRIPDYLEDANGDGLVDEGETNWALAILTQPVNQTVPYGLKATFSVVAEGIPLLSYQWYFNATNVIAGATNSSWTVTNVQPANQGGYSVVVGNSSGSLTSAVASLNLQPTMVVGWGDNGVHQCDVPFGLTNTIAIAAGDAHGLALLNNQTVVGWGWNFYGQATVPTNLTGVAMVAAGWYHSVALLTNGTVVAWGIWSSSSYLGGWYITNVPANLTNAITISAQALHTLALRSDGTVAAWGYGIDGETNVPVGLSNVTAISAGYQFNLAVSNSTVVAWGDDSYGQCDVPAGLSNVVDVAAGLYHSVALLKNGTVVAWGADDDSETNVPIGLTNVVAIAAGGDPIYPDYYEAYSMALNSEGAVVVWGDDAAVDPVGGLSNVIEIAAGGGNALAVRTGPPTPVITLEPTDQYQVPGGNVTFTARGAGLYGVTYQWQFTNVNIFGATNATLTLSNLQSGQFGGYDVIVTDNGGMGSIVSSNANLYLVTPPIILSQTPLPTNQVAVFQSDLTLSVTASAPGQLNGFPLGYQWQFNGTNVSGANSSNYTFLVDTTTVGTYSVIVSNAAGSVSAGWQVALTYDGSYIAPGTLAYHLSTNAVGYANGYTGSSNDETVLANWTAATYVATNMALLTNAVWSTNCWLHGVQGLSATPIGMSNHFGGGTLLTMISPRHYLRAQHTHSPPALIAFLDTNNIVYWRRFVQQVDIDNDTSIGILDADLPPSVGFLPVIPTNFANYLPTTTYSYIQGIGMNQDMRLFGQPMTLLNPMVDWNSTVVVPFGLGINWNVTLRPGDSSNPEMLLINNQLVLVSHNFSVGTGPNYAYQISAINQQMHYLSTNNNVGTDYQLALFPLTNWPTIH